MESNNTGNNKSRSVGKENNVANCSLSSSFDRLEENEDRTAYFERQGLTAIIEYEKREKKVKLTSQEEETLRPQLKRLDQQIDYHRDVVLTYLIEPELKGVDSKTGTNVKQVEDSITWLETVEPPLGQSLKKELLLKQSDRFKQDKLSAKSTENTDSKIVVGDQNERQLPHEQYTVMVPEPSLTPASKGLGGFSYLLSGLFFLYVANKIYELIHHYKNKK